jgi:hypothetical protein
MLENVTDTFFTIHNVGHLSGNAGRNLRPSGELLCLGTFYGLFNQY